MLQVSRVADLEPRVTRRWLQSPTIVALVANAQASGHQSLLSAPLLAQTTKAITLEALVDDAQILATISLLIRLDSEWSSTQSRCWQIRAAPAVRAQNRSRLKVATPKPGAHVLCFGAGCQPRELADSVPRICGAAQR